MAKISVLPENIINQIEVKNKERIKELKKENKRIDKYINTSDIIIKLNNIGINSNLDKEITINSAFKNAEKQIMDNLSAEIFKSTRSIIDKLQERELNDMTEELSKVATEIASEVASDSVFKESTSTSVLDRKVGGGMVTVRHLIAAGRLPN